MNTINSELKNLENVIRSSTIITEELNETIVEQELERMMEEFSQHQKGCEEKAKASNEYITLLWKSIAGAVKKFHDWRIQTLQQAKSIQDDIALDHAQVRM